MQNQSAMYRGRAVLILAILSTALPCRAWPRDRALPLAAGMGSNLGRPQNQTRRLGGGAVSKAWAIGPDWVVKIVRRRGMWMPQHDAAKRKALADQTVLLHDLLRANPEFVARFGRIIPETCSPRPGTVLQRRVSGLKFSELGLRSQLVALQQMQDVTLAAEKAAPGHKIDVFNGLNDNFVFDPGGKLTGWFDAAHPDWILKWRPGMALGQGARPRETMLDHAGRITAALKSDHTIGHRAGQLFRLHDGLAQRYSPRAGDWGDKLLISNPRTGSAHLVQYGFCIAYTSNHDRAAGRPLFQMLGLPLEDEHPDGRGGTLQRFEHGSLSWSPTAAVAVHIDAPAAAVN
jgi:hypothetical protein